MYILRLLRQKIQGIAWLRRIVAYHIVPSGLFDKFILKYKLSDFWSERVILACESPDNAFIPRVPDAGKIHGGKQIMHNGLRINVGSYYGFEKAILMHKNRGVHEPQEERVFQEVLLKIQPGSVMIEMGAFWSFYSLWFQKVVPHAQNFMLEPIPFNLESGVRNFRLNEMLGSFHLLGISDRSETLATGMSVVCMDDFTRNNGIDHVHLLHSDIQGFEVAMLNGSKELFSRGAVDWVFISTHGEELHQTCIKQIFEYKYSLQISITPSESYSEDGLIVASRSDLEDLSLLNDSISRRSKH